MQNHLQGLVLETGEVAIGLMARICCKAISRVWCWRHKRRTRSGTGGHGVAKPSPGFRFNAGDDRSPLRRLVTALQSHLQGLVLETGCSALQSHLQDLVLETNARTAQWLQTSGCKAISGAWCWRPGTPTSATMATMRISCCKAISRAWYWRLATPRCKTISKVWCWRRLPLARIVSCKAISKAGCWRRLGTVLLGPLVACCKAISRAMVPSQSYLQDLVLETCGEGYTPAMDALVAKPSPGLGAGDSFSSVETSPGLGVEDYR